MRSDEEKEEYLLAGRWTPPGELGGAAAVPGDPVACIATTYSFEAPYFESVLLPRFLGLEFDADESGMSFLVEREDRLGQAQVVVLVNADHYDPRQASSRWLQLSVRVPQGAQHSKVSVLVWENLIRIIVASANLTKAGYRRNREVAAVLDFFDGAEAVPRQALVDALGFLREIQRSGWVRGGDEALARLDEALAAADTIQRRWKKLRGDFRPRDLPRLAFAPTMPTKGGKGVARSPLKVVQRMWGTRSASEVRVVTPFVGQPPDSAEAAISMLRESFPQRATAGHLAVPGDEHNGETYTKIPASFWEGWKRHWSRPGKEPKLWVVKSRRPEEEVGRPLHAKALIVQNDQNILLLCGSSNFSVHGMGVGVANVEANVCYLDDRTKRDRCRLSDRVGVDWDRDDCDDAKWPQDVPPDEEEAIQADTVLPPFFLWARHDELAGTLVVGVDPRQAVPDSWAIYVRGQDGEPMAPPLARSDGTALPNDLLTVSEIPSLRRRRITALWVTWQDAARGPCRAWLPVQVESPSAVAGELVEGFSAGGILACLAGDYDPARYLERRARREIQRDMRKPLGGADDPHKSGRPDDAHKAIDTSRYALYRIRELGQALAVLARRVSQAPRHPSALKYRLFGDYLSPVNLARALRSDWPVEGTSDLADALAFAIAEIRLTLAYVFAAMPAKDRRALGPLFREAMEAIGLPPEDGVPASSLRDYIAQAEARGVTLLQEGTES